jgi:hypothetical protein
MAEVRRGEGTVAGRQGAETFGRDGAGVSVVKLLAMKINEHADWKLPAFGEFCPSPLDWGRLAAFIDGEGSILINTQKRGGTEARGFYLRVTVANTDVRLPVWLKETFGGTYKDANTPSYYVGKNVKRCYHWGASARRAAWILHNCAPYFIIKGEQAELGIGLQESLSRFTRGPGKRVPPEIHAERKELKRRLLVMKARGAVREAEQEKRIAEVS